MAILTLAVAIAAGLIGQRIRNDGRPADQPIVITLPEGTTGRIAAFTRFSGFADGALAIAGDGGKVSLYDQNGKLIRTLDSRENTITALAFDPLNRDAFATGGQSGYLKLWRTRDPESVYPFPAGTFGGPVLLAFNPFLRNVIVAATSGQITVLDTDRRQVLHHFSVDPAPVTLIGYDQLVANTLAVVTHRGVGIWDTSNSRHVRDLQATPAMVTSLAFDTLTRNTLALGSSTEGAVGIWDFSTGTRVRQFTVPGGGRISAMAFNPGIQNSLAVGTDRGRVLILDSTTGAVVHEFTAQKTPVTSLAYAQDGHLLAVGVAAAQVLVWPVKNW